MKNSSRLLSTIENKRRRLYFSLVLALLVLFVTYSHFSGFVSFLFTWLTFADSNLASAWIIIISLHPKTVKALAKEEDSSNRMIFLFVVLTAFISLFTIVFLLRSIPSGLRQGLSWHILLSMGAVFSSWALLHTVFTLRYAHLYYSSPADADSQASQSQGLEFPNESEPDYLDFAYFSFVVGMTFQVSDVQITSRKIRRLNLVHSLLSFVYNTIIVALSINIISGIIGK